MLIDLANLEWWQTLIGILGVLGLSPAPWLLGMATGKIQFTAPAAVQAEKRVSDIKEANVEQVKSLVLYHDGIIKAKDDRYADLLESRNGYKAAVVVERDRAEKSTEMLGDFTELGKLAIHALTALDEAVRENDVPG